MWKLEVEVEGRKVDCKLPEARSSYSSCNKSLDVTISLLIFLPQPLPPISIYQCKLILTDTDTDTDTCRRD